MWFLFSVFLSLSLWGQEQREFRHSVEASPSSVQVQDHIFIRKAAEREDFSLERQVEFGEWLELQAGRISYGSEVSQTTMKTLSEEGGRHLIFSSSLKARLSEEQDQLRAQISKEIKAEESQFIYLGSVNYIEGQQEDLSLSVSFAHSQQFDPCLLETSSIFTLKREIENFYVQGGQGLKVNCVFSENLKGEWNARMIFTNSRGEILKRMEIEGEFTWVLTESLSLKYQIESYRGENPLTPKGFGHFSTENDFSAANLGGLSVADVYFSKTEDPEKFLQKLILQDERNHGGCQQKRTLELGFLESRTETTPLYFVSLENTCAEGEGDDLKTQSQSLSFGNQFSYEGKRIPTLSAKHFYEDPSQVSLLSFSVAWLKSASPFYEVEYSNQNLEEGIQDTYRLISSEHHRLFVYENIYALSYFSPLRFGENLYPCVVGSCASWGWGVSLSDQGGLYVSAKTEGLLTNEDWNLSFVVGHPINSEGVNGSWGRSLYEQEGSSSFFEFSLSSWNCDSREDLCVDFSFRKDENATTIDWGGILRF